MQEPDHSQSPCEDKETEEVPREEEERSQNENVTDLSNNDKQQRIIESGLGKGKPEGEVGCGKDKRDEEEQITRPGTRPTRNAPGLEEGLATTMNMIMI